MITEAITHGQAAGAGRPVNGANASATTAAPSEINTVVASGSSPRLIAAFQPAWQAAANSTAAKTNESMAGVFHVASSVMRGLVPGIHVFLLFAEAKNDVDDSDARAFARLRRAMPGHDERLQRT